jgi:hypothetical protein
VRHSSQLIEARGQRGEGGEGVEVEEGKETEAGGAGRLEGLTRSAHSLLQGFYHPLVARRLQAHFGEI